MSKQTYLINTAWEKLAINSSDLELKELVLTGGGKMEELPSSPIELIDRNASIKVEKILDFGCGIGRNFKHYKKFYREVHGYDLPPMVDRCQSMCGEKVDLLTSDWKKISSNTYDMVAAQFVFQHFLNPLHLTSLLADISEISQYLYVSGRCYMDNGLHDKVFDIILTSNRFELIDSQPAIDKLRDIEYPSEACAVALFKSQHFKGEDTKQHPQTIPTGTVDKNQHREVIKRRIFKTENEEVEIIILTRGNYNLTEECILSILKHVKYSQYRITLFDTGSPPKAIQQYQDLEQSIPSLTYKSFPSYHFSRNYNQAISNSECSYVLMLNNDTLALNDFVSEMMKYAVNNKVGAVGCQLFYPNNTIQHGGQLICNPDTGKLIPLSSHYLHKAPTTYQANRFVDGVTGACTLISKSVYEEMGGLSTSYQDIYQDTDLMLRLRDSGYEIYLSNDAKMIHYDGATRNPSQVGIEKNAPATDIMMEDADTFQDTWIDKSIVKTSQRGSININQDPIFSFVTLVNDKKDYFEFLDSIETEVEYEVIGLKNYDNFFDCPTGLNTGAELSVGKYIIFCHQDILLCPQWCEKTLNHIAEIEKTDKNWGVLGIAGLVGLDERDVDLGIAKGYEFLSRFYLSDSPTNLINSNPGVLFSEVQTIDELLLVCKNQYTTNTSNKYFDPKLYGFHFYGADLCLNQSYKFGAKSYTINCPVFHKSTGGMKNLQTEEQWRSYVDSRQRFKDKWQTRGISQIVTTTCCMDIDGILSSPTTWVR